MSNRDWLHQPTSAHPLGALHCTEPYQDTLARIRQPGGIRAANHWARLNRPVEYTCNLRPGLPLWLFWTWQSLDVPIRGVIVEAQLHPSRTNHRHNEILTQIQDAWALCTWQEVHTAPNERDAAAATYGEPVTMASILPNLLAHA